MNWRVLVLDQGYEPVKIVDWTRAMTLVLSGKAEFVDEADIYSIRSSSATFYLTSIIRVLAQIAHRKRKGIPFTQHNIFMRDRWTCQYCGTVKKANQLNWDHVFPKSRGGKSTWENIVSACYPCNQKKADRTPEEARMKLLKKPSKPPQTTAFTIRMKGQVANVPESWKTYLDPASFAYWHVELQSE